MCKLSSYAYRLQRFEKTNEMLVNCNALSQVHLQKAALEFKKHVQILNEVKKDLENIFKRVKAVKAKTASQYPPQFESKSHKKELNPYIRYDKISF